MKRRCLVLIAIAVCAVAVLAQSDDPRPVDLQQTTTVSQPQSSPVRFVEMINFPDPQNVAGTVNVGNLPSTQQVAGTVAVSNLPVVQQVEVVNLPPSSQARFQLVGFTAATFTGGHGVFGFTAACQAELPGSRMCTLEEAVKTVTIPDLGIGSDNAWVTPLNAYQLNGVHDHCDGWNRDDFSSGMTISKTGQFRGANCNDPLSVACCAPVE